VRSAVEQIAVFAGSARPEHLRSDARQLFQRNILDSLGCVIAGLQGRPFHALREQFEEYRAPGRYTLIGAARRQQIRRRSLTEAWSLCRFAGCYMALGVLCHPSDNFGTILAAAEQAGTSGDEMVGNNEGVGRYPV
jgi:2-methylcitrate dehydratase